MHVGFGGISNGCSWSYFRSLNKDSLFLGSHTGKQLDSSGSLDRFYSVLHL